MDESKFHFFVGIDWGRQEHEVAVINREKRKLGERTVPHSGRGLAKMCEWLVSLTDCPTGRVAVALERPDGAIVDTLLDKGFAVFSVNPKQLDRFRDRYSLAGAKDDRLDALVAANVLVTDMELLRRLETPGQQAVALRHWSRTLDELQKERRRIANRIDDQLWRYYPQMAELGCDATKQWWLELWHRIPTPSKARRIKEVTVGHILTKHKIRVHDAATILKALRQPALHVVDGATDAAVAALELLSARMTLLNAQHRRTKKELCAALELFEACIETKSESEKKEQSDVAILLSLPGIGEIVLAALLSEAPEAFRKRDYHKLRCLCGSAPVTRRTGKRGKKYNGPVLMRRACNPRLRNALHHWTRMAMQKDPWSKEFYRRLRSRGCGHNRALRGLGDRLLNVACAMLRDGTMYDPSKKLARAGI